MKEHRVDAALGGAGMQAKMGSWGRRRDPVYGVGTYNAMPSFNYNSPKPCLFLAVFQLPIEPLPLQPVRFWGLRGAGSAYCKGFPCWDELGMGRHGFSPPLPMTDCRLLSGWPDVPNDARPGLLTLGQPSPEENSGATPEAWEAWPSPMRCATTNLPGPIGMKLPGIMGIKWAPICAEIATVGENLLF